MAELLVEVRCGVLPAARVSRWAVRLKEALVRRLREVGMAPRQSAVGYSGRRMMVLLRGVGEHSRNPPEPEEARERAGAALGRALDELAEVVQEDGWDLRAGGPRPLAIVAVLGGSAVPLEWCGVTAGTQAVGHRLGEPRPFRVDDAESYRRALETSGVEIRYAERRRRLTAELGALLDDRGLGLDADPPLLELLATECESPTPVLGSFDPVHLSSPRELVRAVLRERQRAFTVTRGGRPEAAFVAVVDHPGPVPASVVAGYQLSVATLLDDVRFHWVRDRALPIAERARRVHAGIRAGGDSLEMGRRERLRALAVQLCADAGWEPGVAESVRAAVELVDAELDTSLVREFPELSGVIGGLLARAEGHPESLWQALYDHPLPRRPRSTLPRGRAALALAATLRVEQIAVECLREQPGRRAREAAEDLVRLLMHGGLSTDVDLFAARACRALDHPDAEAAGRRARALLAAAVCGVLEAEGFSPSEIRAVRAGQAAGRLPDLLARARALSRLRDAPRLSALVATARRLPGILDRAGEAPVDPALLVDPAEKELHQRVRRAESAAARRLAEGRWDQWLSVMFELNAAVERFLAEVLVHDEVDRIRINRLALLFAAHQLYTREIKLAELEG